MLQHTELKPGQVITGRRLHPRRQIDRRIALLLLGGSLSLLLMSQLYRQFTPVEVARNTTVTTTGVTEKPAVVCGALGCSGTNHTGGQSVKGGGHTGGYGGSGTIHIGS